MKLTSTLMMCLVCLVLVHIIESVKQMVLKKRAAQENYIFPENLLFESEAGSAIGCARICCKTPACVMFTVTVTSLGTTCRGHTLVMTSASQRNWTASTSMYITSNFEWLERECSSDAECGVPLSECFAGRCLCSPGYYFSNSNGFCLEGCAQADLQTTLLTYPDYFISMYNIDSLVTSKEDCVTVCGQYQQARTCDYVLVDGVWKCCLQAVTKRDVPPAAWGVRETATHYQKTCV
ncbi:hypothetical protein V1264_022548 [Littorina saxatilis]|uniref:Uncharacterized protein n=1 Tax=Littorina saxatilis TaxID=31220 RepID=A0AAN9AKS4_9CAEN